MATLQTYQSPSLISESRVIDIRDLDVSSLPSSLSSSDTDTTCTQVMSTKILENDLYVFVISWRTQEILAYRDLATGEITEGNENKIVSCGYVAVLTRIEDELDNTTTGGWKIIDVSYRLALPAIERVLMSCWYADGEESSINASIAVYSFRKINYNHPRNQIPPLRMTSSFRSSFF